MLPTAKTLNVTQGDINHHMAQQRNIACESSMYGAIVTERAVCVRRLSQKAYLRLNAHDIASMTQLGHTKATWQVQGVQPREIFVEVLLCAKLGDCTTTQCEVHTCLDTQAVIA